MSDERSTVVRKRQRKPATKRVLICENCGAEFMFARIDAEWCSRSCHMDGQRKRALQVTEASASYTRAADGGCQRLK
jgi:hypothetical protein